MKLFNAFSLQMIDIDIMANVQFEAINKEKPPACSLIAWIPILVM